MIASERTEPWGSFEWRPQYHLLSDLTGIPVRTDQPVPERDPPIPRTVVRSWRERLFTRPWRPWQRTKTVWRDPETFPVYMINDTLYVHPNNLNAFVKKVEEYVVTASTTSNMEEAHS